MYDELDRVWPAAFIETKQTCRPNEPARNPLDLQAWMLTGSWLMKNLEDGGFGNNVEVRPYMTFTTAKDLDELTDNMMFASQAYFQKYSEEEMVKARAVMREALRKCRTFVEDEDGVRIGMKAWIGVGWKRGDEKEVPQ